MKFILKNKIFILIFVVLLILFKIFTSDSLQNYPWGDEAKKILDDMGVESVKKISLTDDYEYTKMYSVDVDDTELKIWIDEDSDGNFEVIQISNNDVNRDIPYGAIFYTKEYLKTDNEGNIICDIYDYKTGNIIIKADEIKKAEYDEKMQEQIQQLIDTSDNGYKEMWYDDIFFGEEDITGTKVKLNLFLEEKCFFTTDALYNSQITEFCSENNVSREFYKCGVLRENENNYAGEQIDLFFSDDYALNPNDYKTGDKIIVEGEIVQYYIDEWDGYNNVIIIPHSIEIE